MINKLNSQTNFTSNKYDKFLNKSFKEFPENNNIDESKLLNKSAKQFPENHKNAIVEPLLFKKTAEQIFQDLKNTADELNYKNILRNIQKEKKLNKPQFWLYINPKEFIKKVKFIHENYNMSLTSIRKLLRFK